MDDFFTEMRSTLKDIKTSHLNIAVFENLDIKFI